MGSTEPLHLSPKAFQDSQFSKCTQSMPRSQNHFNSKTRMEESVADSNGGNFLYNSLVIRLLKSQVSHFLSNSLMNLRGSKHTFPTSEIGPL